MSALPPRPPASGGLQAELAAAAAAAAYSLPGSFGMGAVPVPAPPLGTPKKDGRSFGQIPHPEQVTCA